MLLVDPLKVLIYERGNLDVAQKKKDLENFLCSDDPKLDELLKSIKSYNDLSELIGDVMNHTQNHVTIILCGLSGSGKSYALKQMRKKALQEFDEEVNQKQPPKKGMMTIKVDVISFDGTNPQLRSFYPDENNMYQFTAVKDVEAQDKLIFVSKKEDYLAVIKSIQQCPELKCATDANPDSSRAILIIELTSSIQAEDEEEKSITRTFVDFVGYETGQVHSKSEERAERTRETGQSQA